MSYDISLIDSKTHKIMELPVGVFACSRNIYAEFDETTGTFYQVPQKEAVINITYNYADYYYEVCKGDQRFYKDNENLGIRAIYGKTAKGSIPLLKYMIENIKKTYQNEDGTWKISDRTKPYALDTHGNKITDLMEIALQGLDIREDYYQISEGDTSDYWEETAANAIIPLQTMLIFATVLENEDCIWCGD